MVPVEESNNTKYFPCTFSSFNPLTLPGRGSPFQAGWVVLEFVVILGVWWGEKYRFSLGFVPFYGGQVLVEWLSVMGAHG